MWIKQGEFASDTFDNTFKIQTRSPKEPQSRRGVRLGLNFHQLIELVRFLFNTDCAGTKAPLVGRIEKQIKRQFLVLARNELK